MRHWVALVLFLLALGTMRIIGCGDESPCGDCNDGNPCTEDGCTFDTGDYSCNPPEPEDYHCYYSPRPNGTPCSFENDVGACMDGVCREAM